MKTFSIFRGELIAFGEQGERPNTPTESGCYIFKFLQSIQNARVYTCRNLFFTGTCFGWPTLFWSPRKTCLRFANNARKTKQGEVEILARVCDQLILKNWNSPRWRLLCNWKFFAFRWSAQSNTYHFEHPANHGIVVCAWLIRYSICGGFCSRGLSPPTIGSVTLQVFRSILQVLFQIKPLQTW